MNRILTGICCLAVAGTVQAAEEKMAFVENEFIRVGINLGWGGAVTHVSVPGGPNLINSHDLGRQIQQSYYSGPPNYQREGKEKAKHWANFPWNPIQTGDAFHNGSEVLEHRVTGKQLYVKTVPKLWPMNNDAAECVMETSITLSKDGPKFMYKARLTNARSDKTQYSAKHQEIPAIYVNGPWHKLMTYNGDQPFTGKPVSEIRNDHKEPWPWVNYLPTERWAALVNDAGTGLGVCVPRVMEFHGGFAGKRGQGGEKSSPTGYMSPMTTEVLDHNIVYEYSCMMILGSLKEIRAEAGRLASKDLPSWTFGKDRQGWYYGNGKDDGWPLKGDGLTVKAKKEARPVRLMGPYTFWRAENADRLRITISSKTAGRMRVFWRGMPTSEASTKPSEWGAWRKAWWNKDRSVAADLPKGVKRSVTVKLTGLPAYDGAMTGLAIDVPGGVTVHDVRLLDKFEK
jgi:hypothetical protein